LTLSLTANGEVEADLKTDVEAWLMGKDYRSHTYLHVATPNTGSSSTAASGSMEPGFFKQLNPQHELKTTNIASSRALGSSATPLSTSGTFCGPKEDLRISTKTVAPVQPIHASQGERQQWRWFLVTQWTNGTGYFDSSSKTARVDVRRFSISSLKEAGIGEARMAMEAQYWWSTGVLATNVADGWVYTNYGLSPGNNNDILQAGDAVYAGSSNDLRLDRLAKI